MKRKELQPLMTGRGAHGVLKKKRQKKKKRLLPNEDPQAAVADEGRGGLCATARPEDVLAAHLR